MRVGGRTESVTRAILQPPQRWRETVSHRAARPLVTNFARLHRLALFREAAHSWPSQQAKGSTRDVQFEEAPAAWPPPHTGPSGALRDRHRRDRPRGAGSSGPDD